MSNTYFKLRTGAMLVAMCAALAGCASTPAPTLLTLPSTSSLAPSSSLAPTASAAAPVLALARMEIPEYIVSRRVRYRADSSTLAEWPDTNLRSNV